MVRYTLWRLDDLKENFSVREVVSDESVQQQGICFLYMYQTFQNNLNYTISLNAIPDFSPYHIGLSPTTREAGDIKEWGCFKFFFGRIYRHAGSPSSVGSYYGADNSVRSAPDIGKRRSTVLYLPPMICMVIEAQEHPGE
ncbi:hypothetical protein Bca52824_001393 [Brassica carinata]|uniref:Uncharacterized protein n=1 Tax=Brassica carinata TaxID=52824 RepID=A0A8X7WFZ4_BRACI|nr:hypothetical protein Bca52824_001393 [Brassica carinata]